MKSIAIGLTLVLGIGLSLASVVIPSSEGDEDAGGTLRADAGTTGTRDSSTSGRDTGGSGSNDATTIGRDSGGTASGCNLANIFWNSPDTCETGTFCTIDNDFQPTCLDDAAKAGGTYYGDCGEQGECPMGAACFNPNVCMPFCDDTHGCPNDGSGNPGVCIYGIEGSDDIMLCSAADSCDPVDNTGCAEGEGCYIVDQDGNLMCTDQVGTLSEGATCQYINDCAPGFICTGTCMQMCHLDGSGECGTGSCVGLQGLDTYGVCGQG